MKINGSNSVQGLFNHATVPVGSIYEVNDIVLHGSTLYVCQSDTVKETVDTVPDVSSDSWEYYLGGVSKIKTFDEFESGSGEEILSLQALKEVIQNYWGGVNSNGSLMFLDNANAYPLDSMKTNSSFQLSYNYMTQLFNNAEISFQPIDTRVYVVRNTGELTNGELSSPTVYTQELFEFSSDGNYKSWIRTGTDLTNTWKPTKGESFNGEYITYLQNLEDSYNTAKGLYESFMQDISAGEYKYWKPVDIPANNGYMIFNETSYETDKYYKVYIHSGIGVAKTSIVVELTPEDFTISPDSSLYLSGRDDIYLYRPVTGAPELRFNQAEQNIVNVVESTTLIN